LARDLATLFLAFAAHVLEDRDVSEKKLLIQNQADGGPIVD
jgi:hypothetical protein